MQSAFPIMICNSKTAACSHQSMINIIVTSLTNGFLKFLTRFSGRQRASFGFRHLHHEAMISNPFTFRGFTKRRFRNDFHDRDKRKKDFSRFVVWRSSFAMVLRWNWFNCCFSFLLSSCFYFLSPEKQAKQKANNGHIRWDQEDGTIIECESFLGS